MKQILAVDDNPANLTMVRETLSGTYNVSVVTSGSQAIRFLEKRSADLILLDVLMPEMDGIETLAKIKSMENVNPIVVMLTALSDEEVLARAIELGAAGCIEKPFRPADMRQRIADLLGE